LGEVLESVPAIDVLKIDTPREPSSKSSMRSGPSRVRTVYLEVEERPAGAPSPFESEFPNET
jgi:hypothetical protein